MWDGERDDIFTDVLYTSETWFTTICRCARPRRQQEPTSATSTVRFGQDPVARPCCRCKRLAAMATFYERWKGNKTALKMKDVQVQEHVAGPGRLSTTLEGGDHVLTISNHHADYTIIVHRRCAPATGAHA